MQAGGGERGECGGGGECGPDGASEMSAVVIVSAVSGDEVVVRCGECAPEGVSEVSAVVLVSAGRRRRAR